MKRQKVILGIGTAVIAIALTVCAARAQETGISDEEKMRKAREYFRSGQEMVAKGDFEAANEAFKNAQNLLKGLPAGTAFITDEEGMRPAAGSVSSYLKKAREADGKGDFKEAAENYRKAAEFAPRNADIHYNAGVEFLKLNQFADAAKAFQLAAGVNPRDKDAYYNLGILFDVQLNDKEKALEYYLRYLSLAPHGNEAESVKAAVALIRGQSEKK